METEKAIGLIEAHGIFHGDHYSFNSGEFVQWCQEDTVTVHREWLDRKNETIVS